MHTKHVLCLVTAKAYDFPSNVVKGYCLSFNGKTMNIIFSILFLVRDIVNHVNGVKKKYIYINKNKKEKKNSTSESEAIEYTFFCCCASSYSSSVNWMCVCVCFVVMFLSCHLSNLCLMPRASSAF